MSVGPAIEVGTGTAGAAGNIETGMHGGKASGATSSSHSASFRSGLQTLLANLGALEQPGGSVNGGAAISSSPTVPQSPALPVPEAPTSTVPQVPDSDALQLSAAAVPQALLATVPQMLVPAPPRVAPAPSANTGKASPAPQDPDKISIEALREILGNSPELAGQTASASANSSALPLKSENANGSNRRGKLEKSDAAAPSDSAAVAPAPQGDYQSLIVPVVPVPVNQGLTPQPKQPPAGSMDTVQPPLHTLSSPEPVALTGNAKGEKQVSPAHRDSGAAQHVSAHISGGQMHHAHIAGSDTETGADISLDHADVAVSRAATGAGQSTDNAVDEAAGSDAPTANAAATLPAPGGEPDRILNAANAASPVAANIAQAAAVANVKPSAIRGSATQAIAERTVSRTQASTAAVSHHEQAQQQPQSDSFNPDLVRGFGGSVAAPARQFNAAQTEASGAASRDTFSALDTETAAPKTTWIHAGARHAEAGYLDPSLGWVSVRADASTGSVHAALVPGSAEAAQTLGSHLAGLNTFMAEQHGASATVTMSSPQPHADAGAFGGQGMGQENASGRNSGRESSSAQQGVASIGTRGSRSPVSAGASGAQQPAGAIEPNIAASNRISLIA